MILSIFMITLVSLTLDTPFSLSVYLIFTAFFLCLTMNTLTLSWFSFLMFLIYIGGMLIMFAYFSALQPNQIFNFFYFVCLSSMMWTFNFIFLAPKILGLNFFSCSSSLLPTMLLFPPNNLIYLSIAIILLVALLSVVKITTSMKSSLRPYN